MKRLIDNLLDNECRTLEGSLTLFLISKVMKVGGREVIEKIFQDDHDLEQFIRLCRTRRNLKRLCEFVLQNVARASQKYRNYFVSLKSESLGQSMSVTSLGSATYSNDDSAIFESDEIQWNDIISSKKSPFVDIIENMWRPGP